MQIGWSPLISELASRGHNITIITSRQMFPQGGNEILQKMNHLSNQAY